MKQVDCTISPYLIYTVQLIHSEVFHQTHPSLSLTTEHSTRIKAVIHNPFTVEQQIHLKPIQSEFIHVFLNEEYSTCLYCTMLI